MQKTKLKIKETKCDDKSCPMPLEFLPNLENGIKNVSYNKMGYKVEGRV